jgi:DNA-binding SARP family transcriptional activator
VRGRRPSASGEAPVAPASARHKWTSGGAGDAAPDVPPGAGADAVVTPLELRVLGELDITRGGVPVPRLATRKDAVLLTYLAVTGRPHPREALAGLLWGESPEPAARASLRQTLSDVRAALGPGVLVGRETVAFDRAQPYHLDAERFAALVAPAAAPPTTAGDGGARAAGLRAALALYRGDFLEGMVLPDAPAFDEWQAGQRERLRQLAVQALQALAAHDAAQGETLAAVDGLTRVLALDPWREEAHRQLMALLAATGQRAAALAQYEACRRVLADALGVEPEPATTALADRLRAGSGVARPAPHETLSARPSCATPTRQQGAPGPVAAEWGEDVARALAPPPRPPTPRTPRWRPRPASARARRRARPGPPP